MLYVTETGRVLSDKNFVSNEKYIEVESYPIPPYVKGKHGYVCGIDIENNKVLFTYHNIQTEPTPEPEEPITKQDITRIQSTVDYIAMMAE